MSLLVFAQSYHIINIEEFLAPFCKVGGIGDNGSRQVAIAGLITSVCSAEDAVFLLQARN